MKQCKTMPKLLDVGECGPAPAGMGSVRVVCLYQEKEPEHLLRDSMLPVSLDSEFAVPVGDGVYEIKTAKQILEKKRLGKGIGEKYNLSPAGERINDI